MSQVPPPTPPAENTGAVVAATAVGGGMLVIVLAIVAVLAVSAFCVIGILAGLLLPAILAARTAAQTTQSMNNVKQIAMAMHAYETAYGRLPPQYTADAAGQPLHSWRTLILPYMEQQLLLDQVNPNEPWNSPSNAPLTQRPMPIYSSPREGNPGSRSSYVVVAGEEFLFNKDQQVRLSDVQDGHSNTIMILEIANSTIPWGEPRDVTLDELQFESEGAPADAPNLVREGAAVGFGDGSVKRLPKGITREDLRPRLTIAGAEVVESW